MIIIDNPVTGKRESLSQTEFNSYMAQTNGAILKWIISTEEFNKFNPNHDELGRFASENGLTPVKFGRTVDDKWLVDEFSENTTYTLNNSQGLLRVIIPKSLMTDPRYQNTIQNSLDTMENLQLVYPIKSEVNFRTGNQLFNKSGVLGETWTYLIDGVPQASTINLSEHLLKPIAEKDLLIHTITHEWGHALDFRDEKKAKEQQTKINNSVTPMTDYGKTNYREAYAEAFAVKFNNSHKGGIWSNHVKQTSKWEEIFKIFGLDSINKSADAPVVSFQVWDTFDANNPPLLIENYSPIVAKFNPNHDELGRFATGNNSIAAESLSRVGGKELNYDWYIEEGSHYKKRDAEVIGQIIHEQGWDKPSLSANVDEFEALAESGDFVRLYRGAPVESLQGLLDGKPWIGNGKAGPGTYVATSRQRAQLFASGGTVLEFLMPKKMFDNAMTASQVREFYSQKTKQLGVREQEWDDAGKFALSAHSGNGLLYAFDGEKEDSAYSDFSSDYVVYNTSALIVKVNK
jgi:hypothetical protein